MGNNNFSRGKEHVSAIIICPKCILQLWWIHGCAELSVYISEGIKKQNQTVDNVFHALLCSTMTVTSYLNILEQWAKKWNMIFNPSKIDVIFSEPPVRYRSTFLTTCKMKRLSTSNKQQQRLTKSKVSTAKP